MDIRFQFGAQAPNRGPVGDEGRDGDRQQGQVFAFRPVGERINQFSQKIRILILFHGR